MPGSTPGSLAAGPYECFLLVCSCAAYAPLVGAALALGIAPALHVGDAIALPLGMALGVVLAWLRARRVSMRVIDERVVVVNFYRQKEVSLEMIEGVGEHDVFWGRGAVCAQLLTAGGPIPLLVTVGGSERRNAIARRRLARLLDPCDE